MLLVEQMGGEITWIEVFKMWNFDSDMVYKSILPKHDDIKGRTAFLALTFTEKDSELLFPVFLFCITGVFCAADWLRKKPVDR